MAIDRPVSVSEGEVATVAAGSGPRRQADRGGSGRPEALDLASETIHSLWGSACAFHPVLGGHMRRVSDLGFLVAIEMGLPLVDAGLIGQVGLIQDIGMLSVPAEILDRSGALTGMERWLVRGHVSAGWQMLGGLRLPDKMVDLMRYHHERLDGSGYPGGLAGAAIPTEGCILGAADVVCAMARSRPYRRPSRIDEVVAELMAGNGSRYRPDVVQACITVLGGRPDLFERGPAEI